MSSPAPALVIRPLRAGDVTAWRTLRLEALRDSPTAFGDSYEEAAHRDEAAFAARLPDGDTPDALFGAFIGDALAGVAGFERYPGIKRQHKGVLWGVYVTPRLRQAGTGEALVQRVIAHARQHVELLQCSVNTTNHRARNLYLRLGFVPYGMEHHALRVGDTYHDEDLLVLRLNANPR